MNAQESKYEFVESLAGLYAATQNDYYRGNISEIELIKGRLDRISGCLEKVNRFSIRGKILAFTRLVACYERNSQDDKATKIATLEAMADVSELLETICTYYDDIEIWADFTETLLSTVDDIEE